MPNVVSSRQLTGLAVPVVLGTCLLLIPTCAHANMGTPLMWASSFHLLVGNWVIGYAEGRLLAWLFHAPRRKVVRLMIGANYTSMIVGLAAVHLLRVILDHSTLMAVPLYGAPRLLTYMVIGIVAATILIEWPFCHFALGGQSGRGRRSLLASVLAQTLSYGVLIPFFLAAGPISALTAVHADRGLSFARNEYAMVYFIGNQDGDVYRIRIDGTERTNVIDADIRDRDARLFVRRSESSETWDLWLHGGSGTERQLLKDIAEHAAPTWYALRSDRETSSSGNFGRPSDLRPENKRDWGVRTGFWPGEGIQAHNDKTGQSFSVALGTPFLKWSARNTTVLPDDQVVFQLDNQVVLLDLNTRKIGVIAMGRGPVVVLDDDVRQE